MSAVVAPSITELHPGDVVLGVRGDHLHTLLGSCVAVVLTDPRRTVGVMCHIVHAGEGPQNVPASTAYAAPAMRAMADLLLAQGLVPSMCEAYVFGGGNMFPGLISGPSVGDHNVERVLSTLIAQQIKILNVDTGGPVYRRLHWTVGCEPPRAEAIAL